MKYLDASISLCLKTEEPSENWVTVWRSWGDRGGREESRDECVHPAEIFHILKREGITLSKVKEIFKAFFESKGLRVIEAEGSLCPQAVELSIEGEVDFVDAHHVLTMKKQDIDEIYTIDSHFDGFPKITKLGQFRGQTTREKLGNASFHE